MIFYRDMSGNWCSEEAMIQSVIMEGFNHHEAVKEVKNRVKGKTLYKREIEAPTARDYIKMGMVIKAVKQYKDSHNCTLREAKDAIDKMRSKKK